MEESVFHLKENWSLVWVALLCFCKQTLLGYMKIIGIHDIVIQSDYIDVKLAHCLFIVPYKVLSQDD